MLLAKDGWWMFGNVEFKRTDLRMKIGTRVSYAAYSIILWLVKALINVDYCEFTDKGIDRMLLDLENPLRSILYYFRVNTLLKGDWKLELFFIMMDWLTVDWVISIRWYTSEKRLYCKSMLLLLLLMMIDSCLFWFWLLLLLRYWDWVFTSMMFGNDACFTSGLTYYLFWTTGWFVGFYGYFNLLIWILFWSLNIYAYRISAKSEESLEYYAAPSIYEIRYSIYDKLIASGFPTLSLYFCALS